MAFRPGGIRCRWRSAVQGGRPRKPQSRRWEALSQIPSGTTVQVRATQPIRSSSYNGRIYQGIVDQDVLDDQGRLAIPNGASAELMVRRTGDNEFIIDLESVNVNGERYAIQTDKNRVESQRDNSLVGTILGAINGSQLQGRAVRSPRDSVLNFRVLTPLAIGVIDRGVDRDGNHYHDWYKQNDYYRDNR